MSSTQAVPYILKPDFISVIVNGRPFQLLPSHPTFKKLATALKRKQWKQVPKLVTLADALSSQKHGNVEIKNGVVFYKGKEVSTILTDRMLELIDHGKPVAHLLKFMDKLYQNPEPLAIEEFYTWLQDNRLPIYSDGDFAAYKYVNNDYTDTHTSTISNKPGERIMTTRDSSDTNWRTQCSSGYHVCSKQYGTYGTKAMEVKINPADVLSAVGGKMRVLQYEVIRELGNKQELEFKQDGYAELEGKMVIDIVKERNDLIKALKKLPTVQRLIKSRKLSAKSFRKASFARLQDWLQKFSAMDVPPSKSKLLENPMRPARIAAGLSISQVAKQMKKSVSKVYNLERQKNPTKKMVDKYLEAIMTLTGAVGVSYPTPAKKYEAPVAVAAAAGASAGFDFSDSPSYDDPYDDEYDGYDEEEDYDYGGYY